MASPLSAPCTASRAARTLVSATHKAYRTQASLAQPRSTLLQCSSSTFFGRGMAAGGVAVRRPSRPSRLHAAQPARASFLGVGAPEAVLVGVVALVLFGPKGLAQAAKSLGATLRAFAPTIRELTQVSSELKSSLEEEIGLNDLRDEFQRPAVPSPRPASTSSAAPAAAEAPAAASAARRGDAADSLTELSASMQGSAEESAAAYDPDIERKREEAARMAWGPGGGAQQPAQRLETMSVQELEAELARRKKAAESVPSQLSSADD